MLRVEKETLIVNIKGCFFTMSSHHDVSVPVDELDELLQTPQAALQAANYKSRTTVLRPWRRQVRENS